MTTNRTSPQHTYYAVTLDRWPYPATASFWRVGAKGDLRAWPTPKARLDEYFGRKSWVELLKGSGEYRDRRELSRAYWPLVHEWVDHIAETIASDPERYAQRFAQLTTRCFICSRQLTDAKSKVLGIGPDCRRGIDEGWLVRHWAPEIAGSMT